MSSTMKKGFCWALAALQVTPGNISQSNILGETQVSNEKPYQDVELDSKTKKGEFDSENVKPTYARQEVADHCSSESCWIVINNKVYDVTRFLRMHPGGDDIILEYGGHDATSAFIDKGHSLDAFEMLNDYCIGEVIKADRFPEKNHT